MKGVIVAAGYGTRFLPATKTLPKEMLPLLDRPAIDIVVDEFIRSGIDEILIITSRRKKALEDYFDREIELETIFDEQRAVDKYEKIRPVSAKIFFVRQQEMRGTGHALLLARPFLGSEPFVVAYPDDLHFGEIPLAKQLMDVHRETGCTVLATVHDPPQLNSYAVPALEDGLYVTDIEEKPTPGNEKSKEASIGRYLYNDEFLGCLEKAWGAFEGEGEFHHVEGIMKQVAERRVVVKPLDGNRVDTGTPEGYLRALVLYVSQRPDLLAVLKEAMDEL